MGCDIHMYIEYKSKSSDRWNSFSGRFNPGRYYYIFGLLCKGVIMDLENGIPERGLPEKLGYSASFDNLLRITETGEEDGCCTIEKAKRWGSLILDMHFNPDGQPYWATHPDYHSHTWLTLGEFEKQLLFYKNHPEVKPGDAIQYFALLSACKTIEEAGNDVRVVLWFDN